MAAKENMSGFEKGMVYAQKLKLYLDGIESLPCYNGNVNVSEIARAAGIPRKSLYKNPTCEGYLEEAVTDKGPAAKPALDQPTDQSDDVAPEDETATQQRTQLEELCAKLERRITSLEQTNASLFAEVLELRRELEQARRKLEQLRHVEAMQEEGRRVIL